MKTKSCAPIFMIIAILLIFGIEMKAQEKEVDTYKGWELSIGAGSAYVIYPETITRYSDYSTGTSFLSEIKYAYNKFLSAGVGFIIINSTDGLTNKTFKLSESFQGGLKQSAWSLGLNGYFTPLNTRKNELFVSLGGGFSMSDFLYVGRPTLDAQSYEMVKNQRDQGFCYQYSAGYKFRINNHFSLGARYMVTHHKENTDHLLFSLGYKF